MITVTITASITINNLSRLINFINSDLNLGKYIKWQNIKA